MKPGKAIIGSVLLCGIILQGWIAQQQFQLHAESYGLMPRVSSSLGGIFTMPLFHASTSHLWGNLLAIFCLSFLLALLAPGLLLRAIIIMWIGGGTVLWLIGRPLWHIGASGLVYGLIAWFPAMALMRRNYSYTVLSLVVFIYYGSAIWGLLPADPGISYEGHISGLLSGILAAYLLRRQVPSDPKPDEPDEELSNEDPYLRFDYRQKEHFTPGDTYE